MRQANSVSLYFTVFLWAILIGAIVYSHIVFYPPYLSNLPESTSLLEGPYPIDDKGFWMVMVPVLLLSLLTTVMLNWRYPVKRKYLLYALAVYAVAVIATVTYFVPEVIAFSKSNISDIPRRTWRDRSGTWLYLSWVRGVFMMIGFFILLRAVRVSRHDDRKRRGKAIDAPNKQA